MEEVCRTPGQANQDDPQGQEGGEGNPNRCIPLDNWISSNEGNNHGGKKPKDNGPDEEINPQDEGQGDPW